MSDENMIIEMELCIFISIYIYIYIDINIYIYICMEKLEENTDYISHFFCVIVESVGLHKHLECHPVNVPLNAAFSQLK